MQSRSPWIARGIKKPLKLKQRLYVKSLKNGTNKNEVEYRI